MCASLLSLPGSEVSPKADNMSNNAGSPDGTSQDRALAQVFVCVEDDECSYPVKNVLPGEQQGGRKLVPKAEKSR